MAVSWAVKELLSAVKMNSFGNRRMTDAEQIAQIDSVRFVGDQYHNTSNKTLQIYHSGTGSTFDITELTNFLFRDETQFGIGSSKTKVYDEPFVNSKGKMNTSVFVYVEFLQYVSLAGTIDATLTDGSSPVTVTNGFSSDPTPVVIYKTFVLDATSFTLDDVLNVELELQNCEVRYVEIRSI